jgi:hypothetical protein
VSPVSVSDSVLLRVRVQGNSAKYSFSSDEGNHFESLGPATTISFSWWKGSRPSLFAFTTAHASGGLVDIDWVRYNKLNEDR